MFFFFGCSVATLDKSSDIVFGFKSGVEVSKDVQFFCNVDTEENVSCYINMSY